MYMWQEDNVSRTQVEVLPGDQAEGIRSDVVQCGPLEKRQYVPVVVCQPGRQPLGTQGLQLPNVVEVRQGQQLQQNWLLLPLLHPAFVEEVEQVPPRRQADVLQLNPATVPLFHVSCQQGSEDGRPFNVWLV